MTQIMILAGEPSGDFLGAQLCRAMRQTKEGLSFTGMGGRQMEAAGVKLDVNSESLAVVGLLETFKQLLKIRKALNLVKQSILKSKPDLVVLIDYPGFNLRMAKFAKQQGCKVLYYASPQIWAWRYQRIYHIKQYVDHMAVLYHFETALYEKEGIPVTFVGHPLIDTALPTLQRETAYAHFNLSNNKPVIALLPGSRRHEVKRMMPLLTKTVLLLKKRFPELQCILPLAAGLNTEEIKTELPPDTHLTRDSVANALTVADAALTVSGTVTLEVALQRVPQLVLYKMSPVSFLVARCLIRVPYISLCNLVAETKIVEEFIQQQATPEAMAKEAIALLSNSQYRQSIQSLYERVTLHLGKRQAAQQAAAVAFELLQKNLEIREDS